MYFSEKKSGIRETDEKRGGCEILAKKGRECGIRTPPFLTMYTRWADLKLQARLLPELYCTSLSPIAITNCRNKL